MKIEILLNKENDTWVYDSFVRGAETPIPEQKRKITRCLNNGLMESITKELVQMDIPLNQIVVEVTEIDEKMFEVTRIGRL